VKKAVKAALLISGVDKRKEKVWEVEGKVGYQLSVGYQSIP
jgi:hypothetical protein